MQFADIRSTTDSPTLDPSHAWQRLSTSLGASESRRCAPVLLGGNGVPAPQFRTKLAALCGALLVLACGSTDDSGVAAGQGGANSAGTGNGSGGTSNGAGPSSSSGGGIQVMPSGGAGSTDPMMCNPVAVGLLRDFKASHPNFEKNVAAELGIVAAELGADKKPVFAAGPNFRTVTNAADFNQWYRDVPNINQTVEHQIDFTVAADGRAIFDSNMFFPLDNRGFGNEGRRHNFHFTFELHMVFQYKGGETFTFRGDDDLFVFVNNKLAIDLGGVHPAQEKRLNLDAEATRLGILPGQEYALDFFQAERHTSESNFRIESTMMFTNCTPILIR